VTNGASLHLEARSATGRVAYPGTGSLSEIAAAATEHGMPSLREEGLRLVREGVTSLEELDRALAAPRAR